jgi:hypothetical protein
MFDVIAGGQLTLRDSALTDGNPGAAARATTSTTLDSVAECEIGAVEEPATPGLGRHTP